MIPLISNSNEENMPTITVKQINENMARAEKKFLKLQALLNEGYDKVMETIDIENSLLHKSLEEGRKTRAKIQTEVEDYTKRVKEMGKE